MGWQFQYSLYNRISEIYNTIVTEGIPYLFKPDPDATLDPNKVKTPVQWLLIFILRYPVVTLDKASLYLE